MLGSGPTFDIAGLTLGLREGLIGLILLVAIYMAFELVRMRYLRNKAEMAALEPVAKAQPVISVTDEAGEDPLPAKADPDPLPEPIWDRPPAALAEGVLRQGMAQEIAQLREELDSVRGELAALRADMLQEMALMRATQTVSPIYGDAMQMAMSGYDAGMIAERCGIARAEAELVVALAKSQNG